MILTIIFSLLLISFFVSAILVKNNDFKLIACILTIILFVVLPISIGDIISASNSTSIDSPERIYKLVDSKIIVINEMDIRYITPDDLTNIKNHNKFVNECNNYFVSFKKEDRKVYELDYDYYFEIYKNQQIERLKGK